MWKFCQIPWALSATSIIYNLPNVPNNLHMTGQVLAKNRSMISARTRPT